MHLDNIFALTPIIIIKQWKRSPYVQPLEHTDQCMVMQCVQSPCHLPPYSMIHCCLTLAHLTQFQYNAMACVWSLKGGGLLIIVAQRGLVSILFTVEGHLMTVLLTWKIVWHCSVLIVLVQLHVYSIGTKHTRAQSGVYHLTVPHTVRDYQYTLWAAGCKGHL